MTSVLGTSFDIFEHLCAGRVHAKRFRRQMESLRPGSLGISFRSCRAAPGILETLPRSFKLMRGRLSGHGGEAFLGQGDGVSGSRIVANSRGRFAIGLDGFVFLAEFLVGLAKQALDEGIVLIGL